MSAYGQLRRALHDRADGLCERCSAQGNDCHHRKLRSRGGGDTMENCVWVCSPCHDWIHRNPSAATDSGWMVPGWQDPAEVQPVSIWSVT